MRIRITFAKTEAMRFTSHLDLHRAWERAFRRAGLPLAYTQGFSPHPRLNLASALPLGFTGDQEIIDAWLEHELSIPEIQSTLSAALPPGLKISTIQPVDLRAPTLQTELYASEFRITFLEPLPDLANRCATLLYASQLPHQWRDKPYDLRPRILGLEMLPPDEDDRPRLLARLSARQGATGRPEEVIAALGAVPEKARVHRTRLIFQPAQAPA
ncbi:MAG: TIGR03936 family radical SAM-associated protein [Chloroflexota bacterium]